MTRADLGSIFEGQRLHAAALALLLVGLGLADRLEAVQVGELWGAPTRRWTALAVGVAVAHQVYVWCCWRMQLHRQLLTRALGPQAFTAYATGFSILALARIAAVVAVALANQHTLPVDPAPLRLLAAAALAPAIYLFYSVHRHFGFKRAFGIDHFDPGLYRTLPLVRAGIFRWSRNAMYVFGFLLLWAVALWFGSAAALVLALFNHLYVWVHYFGTERPDMRHIYG